MSGASDKAVGFQTVTHSAWTFFLIWIKGTVSDYDTFDSLWQAFACLLSVKKLRDAFYLRKKKVSCGHYPYNSIFFSK